MNTNEIKEKLMADFLSTGVMSAQKFGARFASITYTNQDGQTAKYSLITGINLVSLYKSDLRRLTQLQSSLEGIDLVACTELMSSINDSLTNGIGNNSQYTLKGYYEPLTSNGEVKLHCDENGNTSLYIRGYVTKKTVIKEGNPKKTVNSSEKTKAKKKLEKELKRGKLRTFKIAAENLHSIRMNGMVLEIS